MGKILGQYLALLIIFVPVSAYACMDSGLLNQQFKVEGIATNMNGEQLYQEILVHYPDSLGGTLKVEYLYPDGRPLASKLVDYQCNPTAPSFQLIDAETGQKEGVEWEDNWLKTFSGNREKLLSAPDQPLIVDAGFDNAIKLEWDNLISGEQVHYHYLLARKARFFKLRLARSAPPEALRDTIRPDVVFFKISPGNRLLNLFATPIYVGYHEQSQTLAYYHGPTNLPMFSDQENIVIRYQASKNPLIQTSEQEQPAPGKPG